MASYRSHEGKALSPASQLCGSCETEMADRYCPECPSALCKNCERGHKKNRFTKDHKIINIGEFLISQTGTQLKNLVKCKPHARDVHQVCVECMVLMCAECAAEHKEHRTIDIQSDPKGLQDVCTEEIKQLLDLGVDLQSDKKECEELIQKYEETNQLIQQKGTILIEKIKECLDEFEQTTQNAKDKLRAMLDDKTSGLTYVIDESDQHVKILTDLRRNPNTDVILAGVVDGIGLINRGEQARQLVAAENRTRDIEQFIQNKSGQNQLMNDAIRYFEFPFSTTNINDWCKSRSLRSKHKIILHPKKGQIGWRFCRNVDFKGSVVLYDRGSMGIVRLDMATLSYQTYSTALNLLALTCINSNPCQYAAIDCHDPSGENHLYLLDDAFSVISSIKFPHTKVNPYFLCIATPVSSGKFIATEMTKDTKHAKFNIVTVLNGKLVIQKGGTVNLTMPRILYVDEKNKFMTIIDEKGTIYCVSLEDFNVAMLRAQPKQGNIATVYEDYGGNFLIGYKEGDIRVFRPEPAFERILVKTGLQLQSLIVLGNQLLVSDENSIYVYE